MRTQALLANHQIERFVLQHRLPARFRNLIDTHYLPFAAWALQKRTVGDVLFLGISGAQGSGKSTLANFLRYALEAGAGWRVAVLSIDDFYRTKVERERLGDRVHRLLATRGVPGTHDLEMLSACIENLRSLEAGAELRLPRFDKSRDDRADTDAWPVVNGPVDMIVLEGWCVGSLPQATEALLQAINPLEAERDPSGRWRRFVNEQLAGGYAKLFEHIDALAFLRVPEFEVVYRWRLEQEEKLAAISPGGAKGIMNKAEIRCFVQHYERITRESLAVLPAVADVVFELDEQHDCVQSRYATPQQ